MNARTTISIELPDGTKDMEVRVSAPEQVETGSWRCWSEIDWPDQPIRRYGLGEDSMQALILSLQMLGAELHASRAHKEGRLNGGQGGYGIPVPPNFRPDLVGDDARFL